MAPFKSGNERFYTVMKKTGHRCYYCGKLRRPFANGPTRRLDITIDHIVPISRGGTDELDNLVPACRACNSAKCAASLDEFRHVAAIRDLGLPSFTREQIEWMRLRGCDLGDYDSFRFWFERRTKSGTSRSGEKAKVVLDQPYSEVAP